MADIVSLRKDRVFVCAAFGCATWQVWEFGLDTCENCGKTDGFVRERRNGPAVEDGGISHFDVIYDNDGSIEFGAALRRKLLMGAAVAVGIFLDRGPTVSGGIKAANKDAIADDLERLAKEIREGFHGC
jgi:hypothetical protein